LLKLVDTAPWSHKKVLKLLDFPESTFYNWKSRYKRDGLAGLIDKPPIPKVIRNVLSKEEYGKIIAVAKANPSEGYRKITYYLEADRVYISESTCYRVMTKENLIIPRKLRRAASKEYKHQPKRPNELWTTDITYIFIEGYGFYYLFTILDAWSRYVVYWELRQTMTSEDAVAVVTKAIEKEGITPEHHLSLLSDNGTQYISRRFLSFLKKVKVTHIRTAYRHPETNGKIERYHRTIKEEWLNKVCYSTPDKARTQIENFVYIYNSQRPHMALGNVTPAAKRFGYAQEQRDLRAVRRQDARKLRIQSNSEILVA